MTISGLGGFVNLGKKETQRSRWNATVCSIPLGGGGVGGPASCSLQWPGPKRAQYLESALYRLEYLGLSVQTSGV
eukprot:2959284-Amphidinium_carterae.2